MHCDEYFSYMGANSKFEDDYPFSELKHVANGQWVTPEYFNDMYAVTADELLDYGTAWNNQKQDVHPPLYYVLLHFMTSICLGSFSMMSGLLLNMICMLAVMVFLYRIFVILLENKFLSAIAVLAYGTCPGVVSTIVFLRMYSLMTLFGVIGLYFFVAHENGKIKEKGFLTGIFFVNILGMLTQYYFLFLVLGSFLTFVLRSVYLIVRGKRRVLMLVSYTAVNAASAVVYLLVWPDCIQHVLSSNRGQEAFQNAADPGNFLNSIKSMFVHLDQGLFLHLGAVILVVACLLALGLYARNCWDEKVTWIVLAGLNAGFYYLIVSQISEMKTDRYLMPIYPFLAVAVLGLLIRSLEHFGKKGSIVLTILLGTFCVVNMFQTPGYLYSGRTEQVQAVTLQEQENGMWIHKDYHWYQVVSNSRFFMNCQNTKIVYNMEDPNLIRDDERLQSLSSVCVYFDSDYDETAMQEYFGTSLWNGEYMYTWLGSGESCNIYLFERSE